MDESAKKQIEARARRLRSVIEKHRRLYHTEDAPEISDEAYDSLVRELEGLEAAHPELADAESPTGMVGGDTKREFAKVVHTTRQWSFDDIFDRAGLEKWEENSFGSIFPNTCSNGCTSIRFISQSRPDMLPRMIEYRLDAATDTILKAEQRPYGICSAASPFDSLCFQPFNSDHVNVDSIVFYVQNSSTQYIQPIITITITGVIKPGTREEETFTITTSATSRHLQSRAVPPYAPRFSMTYNTEQS